MTTATRSPYHSEMQTRGIRPVHPLRDAWAVVELIALGFGAELDPYGQKMLREMRRLARWGGLWAFLLGRPAAPTGFVWTEGERVVANLSLRRALPRSSGGWLIGNVVVHPDYRGQGIGRALLEHAIAVVRRRGGRWLGLDVRADNTVARNLYERLGFQVKGRTHHLVRRAAKPWPDIRPPRRRWLPSRPAHARGWELLASAIYTPYQQKVLEIRPAIYLFGGWERALGLWLAGQREEAWIVGTRMPRLAVRVWTDRRSHFHLWDVLVHPREGARGVEEAMARLVRTMRSLPLWPVVAVVGDDEELVAQMHRLGFRLNRTLLQMVLPL